jgi:hypothetical protein
LLIGSAAQDIVVIVDNRDNPCISLGHKIAPLIFDADENVTHHRENDGRTRAEL